MKDKIRYLENSSEDIDEIVMSGADVHLEMLDDYCCMLILDNGKKHWHFNIFFSNRKSHGELKVQRYE